MDSINEYLYSQRVLDSDGNHECTLFGAPLYKSLKAAKISKKINGKAGFIQPNGEPAFLMGDAVITFFSTENDS